MAVPAFLRNLTSSQHAYSDPLLKLDIDGMARRRGDLVRRLEERLEAFCACAPLSELSVVFHSTGVNYARQFWVLAKLGRERLRQFKRVDFVSGSVIAAVVYYSYRTGNLQYRHGDARRWERDFFDAHGLSPMKSALRVPTRLLSGRPILSRQVQMDVIQAGIGKEFGQRTVSFFPDNFHFWLFDDARGELLTATPKGDLEFLKLVQLAVAATAVPRLFHPVEIGALRLVDPVFSRGRRQLAERLRGDGPTLVSNMVVEQAGPPREFIRPHSGKHGRMTIVREALQFCFGLSNPDHLDALEGGLGDLRLT